MAVHFAPAVGAEPEPNRSRTGAEPEPNRSRTGADAGTSSELRSQASIYHIIADGQSLALGDHSWPIVSEGILSSNLMFAGGLSPQYSDQPDYGTLVPHRESQRTFHEFTFGETPFAGLADLCSELFTRSQQSMDFRFLFSSAAVGYASVSQLTVAPRYGYFLDHLTHGRELVLAEGARYRVPAVLWLQGERDSWDGASRSQYRSQVRTLFDQIKRSIAAATPGEPAPVFLTYQTSSHRYHPGFPPEVAIAQLEVSGSGSGVVMASPTYFLPFIFDGVHLTATGERWLGGYFGAAFKRVVIDGGDWRPVQPVSARRDESTLRVKFYVPSPPLVADLSRVPAQPNYGFTMADASGLPIPIRSATISDSDEITFNFDTPVPVGAKLRYGWGVNDITPSVGNIRDSAGKTLSLDIEGTAYPLHNWLAINEFVVGPDHSEIAARYLADCACFELIVTGMPGKYSLWSGDALSNLARSSELVVPEAGYVRATVPLNEFQGPRFFELRSEF